MNIKIGLVGLGYVGLPLLVELSKKFKTIGFDTNKKRVDELKRKIDRTKQITKQKLRNLNIYSQSEKLNDCNVYIVTVPTPITKNNKPNLKNIITVTNLLAKKLKPKDTIIYESTVFPGCTENICGKIIEKKRNFILNKDFFLGYSPERISPGETTKNIKNIVKIVSGSNSQTTNFVNFIYKKIIKKTFIAKNIKIAEAAKVIENTQRDLNIAFVNELAQIFHKMGISTREVLTAASTKWNFLNFEPGIVGGHCIGVDPYYLTHISEKNGYKPNVILSGRKINDSMGVYLSKRYLNLLKKKGIVIKKSRLLIMGLTFKENCPDIRNSKVFDIINFLNKKNIKIDVFDPWVSNLDKLKNKNFKLITEWPKNYYDGVILAVKHREFKKITFKNLKSVCKKNNIIFDIKGLLKNSNVDDCL